MCSTFMLQYMLRGFMDIVVWVTISKILNVHYYLQLGFHTLIPQYYVYLLTFHTILSIYHYRKNNTLVFNRGCFMDKSTKL